MGRRYLMDTSIRPCDPRTVDIYINDRRYCTFTNCIIPIDVLQRRLIRDAIIGDGKIMIVERDDYNNPKPSTSDR